MTVVRIGNRDVGDGQPCYVIAEIGINHNGDVAQAKRLISVASAAECNAVKFQKRTIDVVYKPEELAKPRENPFGATNGDLKYQRTYPKGAPYAHVVGYKSVVLGSTGIEKLENDYLSGNADSQFADRVEPMAAVLWELLHDPTPEKQQPFGPTTTDMSRKPPAKGIQDR